MPFKLFLTKLNRRDTPLLPKFNRTVKIILFILFAVTSIFFVTHSLAATNVLKQTITGMQAGGNLESWLGQDSLRINSVGMLDALTGIKDAPPDIINGISSAGKMPFWIPGGLINSVNGNIASLYNPPLSGIQYLAQIKDEFLGKPAYAQGVGFKGLQPLLPIWRAFRNVVYILSSLIFIIIGIMIMLRVKISPQAVIGLQNAIPQLITALILVTFSYAIAGLIIDLMYFFQSLVLAIIFTGVGKNLSDNLFKMSLISTNFANLSNFDLGTVFLMITNNVGVVVITSIGAIIGAIIGFIVGSVVPIVGNSVGAVGGGVIGGVLFALIISIIILISIIKFFFGLIKCYVTLIIKIILAPLEIGMGAFPNSKMGFSTWILDVIANISVFPISIIFLVLVNIIAGSSFGLWAPNIISFSGISGVIPVIIALGGIILLPKLPEMIPQYIFMLKPSPWGTALGEGMKPENLPLVGGAYSNYKAAHAKSQGEAIDDSRKAITKAVSGRLGFGAKEPVSKENDGSGI